MRRDPLIIGAGPAGTAAAITLGRAGHRPILLEKASGPTDKVCGDFLSADTIGYARSLGVDPAALGAAPIRTVRITTGNRTVEAELPFAAVGLSAAPSTAPFWVRPWRPVPSFIPARPCAG